MLSIEAKLEDYETISAEMIGYTPSPLMVTTKKKKTLSPKVVCIRRYDNKAKWQNKEAYVKVNIHGQVCERFLTESFYSLANRMKTLLS